MQAVDVWQWTLIAVALLLALAALYDIEKIQRKMVNEDEDAIRSTLARKDKENE